MKAIFILLFISNLGLSQSQTSCNKQFIDGVKAGDSLFANKRDYRVWYDWNVFEIGTYNTKFYRCENENYYSYNPHLYQVYAELLIADSIFLFPYFNFYQGECFLNGVKAVTDSILALNGYNEEYFHDKMMIAERIVETDLEEIEILLADGNERKGGDIIEKHSNSIEKALIMNYTMENYGSLPPFYFTPFMGTSSIVQFCLKVNKRGVIKEIQFGNFGEYAMQQNETLEQIELIKEILTQGLLSKKIYQPYFFNGKKQKFKTDVTVSIVWK